MIMKTNLRKMILWTIALLAISIMTTSSVNPGYDEFGNDINECLEDPCPEGYTCMNLPEVFCEKLQMVKLSKEMEILVVKVIKCMMVIVVSAHL